MWLISIIVLILMLGVLVLLHEFGHFIVARLCGVHVYEPSWTVLIFGVVLVEPYTAPIKNNKTKAVIKFMMTPALKIKIHK